MRTGARAHAERFQKILAQDFAGVYRPHSVLDHVALHGTKKSVVINDLNVTRAISGPHEAHAPLLVDAHTVLPLTVARQ